AAAVPGRARLVVLTNVDRDHVETIGPGLEDIAREKAAAFAPGAPALTAATGPALEVAREVARARGVTLHEVEPLRPYETTRAANERLAAAALELLGVPPAARAAALAAPPLPARGERFRLQGRDVLLDGAHDPAAALRLGLEAGSGFTLPFGAQAGRRHPGGPRAARRRRGRHVGRGGRASRPPRCAGPGARPGPGRRPREGAGAHARGRPRRRGGVPLPRGPAQAPARLAGGM